jgi:hypothetical protein
MSLSLVPTPPREHRRERRRRPPSHERAPVAWWKLVIGFASALALLGALGSADGIAEVMVLGAVFGALGLAGWLWGYDSRDGEDRRSAPPS